MTEDLRTFTRRLSLQELIQLIGIQRAVADAGLQKEEQADTNIIDILNTPDDELDI